MEFSQIDLYEFLTESELQHYYNALKNELKITSVAQFKYASDEDLKHIGLSRPEIRRLRKFYEKHFPHGYLSKIKRLLHTPTLIVKRADAISTRFHASSQQINFETTLSAKDANSPSNIPNKHIIPTDSITVNKQLGTGEFGIVQQGVWNNGNERIQVAIKCLCREQMQSNPLEFLKEAAVMHSIEHENIVRLYGVVLGTVSMMLVSELAHLRSLLECLKDSGLRVSFLTIPTLCEFAMQICNGMRYLENKRLIHRDLAARKILVFSKNKVKISDVGLSRALGVGKDCYKTNFNVNLKLPIAWCAPECINYLRFTNASDVWAYGVCLWEMFSYGFQPWAALTGLQIITAIDAPNYQRLEQPDCCPREYYTLMMKCWQDDPIKRPKFYDIYEMLPDMKPEQLKTVSQCLEPKKDHLLYYQGDIITVLDRNTGTSFWKGVLVSGKIGLFNPSNTVAFLEGLPSSNRDSFSRTSERYSKRKLKTEMISKPQNDFKHTGHVGIDGASFGDIAFLGNTQTCNHVPRQIVTPYKPSEDIEQTPLVLPPPPTSPNSLPTASVFSPDGANTTTMNLLFIPSTDTQKHFSIPGQSSFEFPGQQASKMFPTVTSFTNPFAKKSDDDSFVLQNNNYGPTAAKDIGNEWYEYHEISDDEITTDKLDFGPSLLDEINSMFGSINATNGHPKSPDCDQTNLKNEFTGLTSKLVFKTITGDSNSNNLVVSTSKKKSSAIVKQISVKDEKMLNQAIEIATEINARSINDLVSERASSTQSPKRDDENSSQLKCASLYSKKKNFTEELQSTPDVQRFRSLNEIKNFTSTDIRIPLFDKESSDFCFEKSREILSRPLTKNPSQLLTQLRTTETERIGLEYPYYRDRDVKRASENIIDIENTLKALNLDFMHSIQYTELDKRESDETLLNETMPNVVSSIGEEIGSATSNLKSAVHNYRNGVQTMFNFNAATNHLDKHLQYINTQTTSQAVGEGIHDQKLTEDKRSSTPDTGFASRDTNISLSRRSSQKSSHSLQDTYYSPKEVDSYSGFKDECYFLSDIFATKYVVSGTSPIKSNASLFSTNRLKVESDQVKTIGGGNRQRSMSFTDDINPISPVLSEQQQLPKRRSPNNSTPSTQRKLDESHFLGRERSSCKPRSVRARTQRRLSYNPIIFDTSSSSGEESDCNRSIARSEYDIRFRASSLYRRRRQCLHRKLHFAYQDDHESVILQQKIYGSNSSIKSAPHYNNSGNRNMTLKYAKTHYDKIAYEDTIYDFGGRGPGNNYGAVLNNASSQNQTLVKPSQGVCREDVVHAFDISRLAGKSQTSNIGISSSSEDQYYNGIFKHHQRSSPPSSLHLPILNIATASNTTKTAKSSQPQMEFRWPEKIHASTIKQNDMMWLQQRPVDVYSTVSSSNGSGDLVFTPHIPPSPAP